MTQPPHPYPQRVPQKPGLYPKPPNGTWLAFMKSVLGVLMEDEVLRGKYDLRYRTGYYADAR